MYFTITTLREAIGEARLLGLANRGRNAALSSEDIAGLNAAITRASSEIDSYVGKKYPVPLTGDQITDAMLGYVLDIIVYRMSPTGVAVTEEVRHRYKDAIAWAEKIGCGKAQLGVTVLEPPVRTVRKPQRAGERTFTKSKLADVL
jgi:phage gp36-like protein